MFGKILKIEDKTIHVDNLKKESLTSYIGYHVVFEDRIKLVGEITFVNEQEFQITLVGFFANDKFASGVDIFPSSKANCRLVYKNELEQIIGNQNITLPQNLLLGQSSVYDGFNISVNVNDFFSNHFAVIGNTGSGKSCGVSRILQNIFADNKKNPINSHIIIFDAYGEYRSALTNIDTHPGINVKFYTSETNLKENDEIIKIPPYLLDADDLALLLNLKDPDLLTTLEKTLAYVYIFKSNDEICKKYKNDIIAKGLLDMLSSGKSAQQIRDQALAFLSKYNTEDINLETTISQPGYNRTMRQCFNIDSQGKLLAVELVMEYLKQYSDINIEQITVTPTEYSLDDLYYALEFAIVSEGGLNNPGIYEKLNKVKTQLHSIINGEQKKFFDYNGFVSRDNFIRNLFMSPNGENVQIIDVDFNGVDDRFGKTIIKIFCKIFYRFVTSIEDRGSFPINVVVEEAHRYIQRDTDIDVIGYNIFDRISKEGRKYGLILGLITQRLSELSATALSQCSNFIIFRMYYPEDIKIISSIASNVTMDAIEKVKSLRPGSALLFGTAFKIPLITQFEIPNPMPKSTNVDIINKWYND
ncbi:MAG: DUF87 domain-containing protein [Firmicutes bacterium]|nr:DUF87 domain-containing protein [Bacillota bacterium]